MNVNPHRASLPSGLRAFYAITFCLIALLALTACYGYIGERGADCKLGGAANAAYDAVEAGEEAGTVPEDTSWTDILEVLGIVAAVGTGAYGAKKGVQYVARKEDATPIKTPWGEEVQMSRVAAAPLEIEALRHTVAELQDKVAVKSKPVSA